MAPLTPFDILELKVGGVIIALIIVAEILMWKFPNWPLWDFITGKKKDES